MVHKIHLNRLFVSFPFIPTFSSHLSTTLDFYIFPFLIISLSSPNLPHTVLSLPVFLLVHTTLPFIFTHLLSFSSSSILFSYLTILFLLKLALSYSSSEGHIFLSSIFTILKILLFPSYCFPFYKMV